MSGKEIQALVDRIEAASHADLPLGLAVLEGLAASGHAAGATAGVADSADAALRLVASELPGWSVSLSGAARLPDSQWTCTLRESGARDDDEVIGVARAPTAALALVGALLRVFAIRQKGYR
ncbi:MAG TPA: hypothetical protein PLH75_04995 [Amaricoccus sp.]|uniref:hypothetical protein n=1 Tax=Amaricoccus sp. TaxID=1872485 RepID=UPI001D582CE7|nr:hypothetical protein [Amaricoccus sp.]MCB1370284.1 hypothetical protein [Paracoccaceae bacterium]MCC0066400.1 hypothetical protein [Rhodovulum sp.]MCB1374901.1 hypothetical protein [Paracoccaceae bacterium]MCB1404387.1 hypothetical protein [Paracoccaceae bacterium]HPG22125.1 hypothetical protein [Amaricoccus sp.]